MKRILPLGLTLLLAVFFCNSALALTPNHSYSVELFIVSADGRQTSVERINAITDADGKLSFQFNNVPDGDITPFLLVQIRDNSGSQQPQQYDKAKIRIAIFWSKLHRGWFLGRRGTI